METIEKSKGPFVLIISEVCMLAGIKDHENAEIQTPSELIATQPTDSDYRTAFKSVGKRNTGFAVDNDEVLVWVSPFNDASQWVVPIAFRSGLLHLCYYSFLAGHHGDVECTTLCESSCTGLTCPMPFTTRSVLTIHMPRIKQRKETKAAQTDFPGRNAWICRYGRIWITCQNQTW